MVCDFDVMETSVVRRRRRRGKDIHPPRLRMGWNQDAFARRVLARADQLNSTLEGLGKAAGGRGDALRKAIEPKVQGPTAQTLLFVATALHWSIGQVMGVTDPSLDLRQEREVDPRKLRDAVRLVEVAKGDVVDEIRREMAYADAVSYAYAFLSRREAEGRPLDWSNAESLEDIIDMLRHL